MFLFHKGIDFVKAFDLWCFKGWRQAPARLFYAAANVGLGYLVYRGYRRTFDHADPNTSSALVMPLMSSTF